MGTVLPNGYGIFKPTLTLDGSTKIFQTAIMYKNDSGLNVASNLTAARTVFGGTGRPFQPSNMYIGWTMARCEGYQMSGGVLTYAIDETPLVGTKASSLGTPVNTSIIVKKITGIVGKRYRGRIMLPNLTVPESDISQAGIIGATGLASLEGQWDGVFTGMVTANIPLYLGHSVSEIAPTVIASLDINPKIGTMGHRIRGY